jgi:hypothetical protein
MKPIFLILLSVLLTGCLKQGITPVSSKSTAITVNTTKADTLNTYDWYNGTTGSAVIQVTCNECTAIVTIGNVSTPFLFNEQGVGQLKYTPVTGLSVYIAVCPDGIKTIKADIFDKTHTSLYSYAGVSGNWNYTYTIK